MSALLRSLSAWAIFGAGHVLYRVGTRLLLLSGRIQGSAAGPWKD